MKWWTLTSLHWYEARVPGVPIQERFLKTHPLGQPFGKSEFSAFRELLI